LSIRAKFADKLLFRHKQQSHPLVIHSCRTLDFRQILERFGNLLEYLIASVPVALPTVLSVTTVLGARSLARKEAIVTRLSAVEELAGIDMLCSDKTGTLTMDKIILEKHCDVVRNDDEDVLRLAYINSFYQTGLKNILDKAIIKHEKLINSSI
jgi:Mg2+-importing ATPase